MAATRKQTAAKPRVDNFDELDDASDFGIEDDPTLDEGSYSDEENEEWDGDGEEDDDDAIPAEHDHVLTLDEILNASDTEEEELYIPQWGGKVIIRSVTKNEFDNLRRQSRDPRVRKSGRSNDVLERELIIAGVVKPVLSKESYERLKERSAGPCIRVLNAIYRLSGLEEEAERARERRFPRK